MARFVPSKGDSDLPNGVPPPADPGDWSEDMPAVCEYLVLDRYDDGTPRTCATLLIFAQEGRWLACLNDRERGRSAWASGDTPDEVLRALDRALQDGSASWRASNGGKGGLRGKK